MRMFEVDLYSIDEKGTPPKWKIRFAQFMVLWSIFSQLFLVISLVHVFQVKTSAGVSLPAYILYIVSSLVWIVYGWSVLRTKNVPILASSGVAGVLAIVMVVAIITYP
jgi:uncharacterized protein with PQ loop repeat